MNFDISVAFRFEANSRPIACTRRITICHRFLCGRRAQQEDPGHRLQDCRREIYYHQGRRKECLWQEGILIIVYDVGLIREVLIVPVNREKKEW